MQGAFTIDGMGMRALTFLKIEALIKRTAKTDETPKIG